MRLPEPMWINKGLEAQSSQNIESQHSSSKNIKAQRNKTWKNVNNTLVQLTIRHHSFHIFFILKILLFNLEKD